MKAIYLFSLAIILLFVAACNDETGPAGPFTEEAEAFFSEDLVVTTQTAFRLIGVNGIIEVGEIDRNDIITLRGTRRVVSDTEEDAEDRLESLTVETGATAEEISVETKQPKNSEGRSYEVDYQVGLPEGFFVTVVNVNGDIFVKGPGDKLAIATVNGRLGVDHIEGDAALATVNGTVFARISPSWTGTLSLGAVNGNLELELPLDTSAMLSAELSNGVISVTDLVLIDPIQTSHSLDARLGSGDGTIELGTVNGNILVRKPSPVPVY